MKIFKSTESYPIKGRGIIWITQPEDMDGLTFGELEEIIRDQSIVMINDRLVKIAAYEYFAIARKGSDIMNFSAGLLVNGEE